MTKLYIEITANILSSVMGDRTLTQILTKFNALKSFAKRLNHLGHIK